MGFRLLLVVGIAINGLLANNIFDSSILSSDKQKSLELSSKQAQSDSDALKKEWINPIIYKYTQLYDIGTDNYDTAKSYIGISQPIFQSGGIYSAIKYAYAMEKYKNLNVELQKQTMIKDALNLLFLIQKTSYTMQKQELLIKNSQIDVDTKKEQVVNGVLDSGSLDNAIIKLNNNKNIFFELKYSKEELINNFANYSDEKYTSLSLPKLDLVDVDIFEKNNINLQLAKSDIKAKSYYKNVLNAKFLPSINLTFDYTKYHDDAGLPSRFSDDTVYGFNITIPIDFNSFDDAQSNKINYLQSKISLQNTLKSEKNFLKNKLAKIKMLDSKLKVAKEDVSLYEKLLNEVKELEEVGMKTASDVRTFKNSKEIKALDIKILNIDKQMQLLEIYAKMYGTSD